MLDNVNTIVGTLCDDGVNWSNIKGEQFVMCHLKSQDYMLPMIISKYYYLAYKTKYIQCKAFPRAMRKCFNGVRKVYSYLECVYAETANPNTPETRGIEIEGTISSTIRFRMDTDYVTKAHFEVKCTIRLRDQLTVQVPCMAYGRVARSFMEREKGEPIRLTGLVSGSNRSLNVLVKNVGRLEVVDK